LRFDPDYQAHGFTPRHFRAIVDAGSWSVCKPGTTLVEEGTERTKVHYLHRGKAAVHGDGQYLGEMSAKCEACTSSAPAESSIGGASVNSATAGSSHFLGSIHDNDGDDKESGAIRTGSRWKQTVVTSSQCEWHTATIHDVPDLYFALAALGTKHKAACFRGIGEWAYQAM
jgi:hypothetical protein